MLRPSLFGMAALFGLCLSAYACSSDDAAAPADTDGGTSTEPDNDAGNTESQDGAAKPDAGGGGKDGGGDAGKSKRRVFITSTSFSSEKLSASGGKSALEQADAICQARASVLGGTWKAWLSTSTTSAYSRIADGAPWYLVDESTLVFASKADLTGDPAHAIDHDETGAAVAANLIVWTGTVKGGLPSTKTCNDWTASDSGQGGVPVNTPSGAWTEKQWFDCGPGKVAGHLYCFEQ